MSNESLMFMLLILNRFACRRRWLCVQPWIVATLLTLVGVTCAAANPSDKQPHASLDVHGQKFSPELLDTAQKLAEQTRVSLEKVAALAKDNKITKVDPMDLGLAHVNAIRLQRAADQLMLLGEPAGVDYSRRAGLLSSAVAQVVLTLQAIPAAAPGISKLASRASEVSSQRAQQVGKIEKLVQRQDWDTAESELYEVYDAIELYAVYMKPEQRSGLYAPWEKVYSAITSAMTAKRKDLALQLLAERATAAAPAHDQLLTDLKAAVAAVGKSGKHKIADKDLTGPELVAHFDVAWQKLQVATLKALAIEWVRAAEANTTRPSPTWTKLRTDYEATVTACGAELAALVAADAARVDAKGAAALYASYLPAVADLVDHSQGKLETPLQTALGSLLAKSAETAANVQAYRAVTDEALRWRERVAKEQAQAKLATYPDAHSQTRAAFMRNVESAGFFEPEPPGSPAKIYESVGKALFFGSPKLVGKPVQVTDVVALSGSSQAGIARYRDRIYARVPLPMSAMAAEIAALESQLMVSETQPPLSLAATRAIRAARRGDLVATGGSVSGLFVEGHITRFATLPDAAALLLPLGPLPADYPQQDQLEQLVLRLDVAPQWVQQRYLFVDVAP